MQTQCDRCGAVRSGTAGCERCTGRRPARDEPSAMFSLASLTAFATVPEDRRAPSGVTGAPAPASSRESSGLIDLRAIQTMLGERSPHSELLAARTAAPASPARAARPSSLERRLSLLLASIMLCTAGLAGALLLRAVARPGPLTPRLVVAAPVEVEEEEETEPPAEASPAAPVAEETEPVAEAPAGPVREASPRRRPERKVAPEGPRRSEQPTKPAPAPEKAAPPEDMPVACLIDPAKCPRKRQEAPAPVVSTPEPSDSLPATLEPADIGEGTRAAKASAVSQCKAMAKGGEAIKVKLSIAGPEGSVLRATPEEDAGNPQLAACCARELATASFKKVKKPQIGAVVTVKF